MHAELLRVGCQLLTLFGIVDDTGCQQLQAHELASLTAAAAANAATVSVSNSGALDSDSNISEIQSTMDLQYADGYALSWFKFLFLPLTAATLVLLYLWEDHVQRTGGRRRNQGM
jgi:hypothetical protein